MSKVCWRSTRPCCPTKGSAFFPSTLWLNYVVSITLVSMMCSEMSLSRYLVDYNSMFVVNEDLEILQQTSNPVYPLLVLSHLKYVSQTSTRDVQESHGCSRKWRWMILQLRWSRGCEPDLGGSRILQEVWNQHSRDSLVLINPILCYLVCYLDQGLTRMSLVLPCLQTFQAPLADRCALWERGTI